MDKDFLKFMSFVAFMEAKKEAERDCSAEDTGWQDTIPILSEESLILPGKRFFSAAFGCPKSR